MPHMQWYNVKGDHFYLVSTERKEIKKQIVLIVFTMEMTISTLGFFSFYKGILVWDFQPFASTDELGMRAVLGF